MDRLRRQSRRDVESEALDAAERQIIVVAFAGRSSLYELSNVSLGSDHDIGIRPES